MWISTVKSVFLEKCICGGRGGEGARARQPRGGDASARWSPRSFVISDAAADTARLPYATISLPRMTLVIRPSNRRVGRNMISQCENTQHPRES